MHVEGISWCINPKAVWNWIFEAHISRWFKLSFELRARQFDGSYKTWSSIYKYYISLHRNWIFRVSTIQDWNKVWNQEIIFWTKKTMFIKLCSLSAMAQNASYTSGWTVNTLNFLNVYWIWCISLYMLKKLGILSVYILILV